MNLTERAIVDCLKISTNKKEFAVDIELTDLEGNSYHVVGLHTKHANSIDKDNGAIVKGKNATCSIHEREILRAAPSYPIRDSRGEVAMIGHKIFVKDSTDEIKNYIVLQNWPDETIGLITFILGDYTA